MKCIKDKIILALGFSACLLYVFIVIRIIKYFWEL